MASADLTVTKTASPTTANIGQEVTYTITVKNNGPGAAVNAALTDSVPMTACLSAIATSQGSYTYSSNVISWTIGGLADQAEATLTVSVKPQAAGTLTNIATVTADNDDNTNNNSDTATVTVLGTSVSEADLAITKTSCPSSVILGESVTYYLRVFNNGPSSTDNVIVTDSLPPGLVPVSADSDKGICSINGQDVTCSLGELLFNERVNIAIVANATATGTFMNSASVEGSVTDPNVTNNTDSDSTKVQPAAYLSITKQATPETVILGELLTYEITVHNLGSSDAADVTVTEILPSTVDVISIHCNLGSSCCTPTALNKYLCQLGTIPANGAATITIIVKPREPGCITNSATVESTSLNLNPCITAVTTTTVKRPFANVAVTKVHSPSPAAVCTPITYTLTVVNNGPFPATGIVLIDQLPSSVEVLNICTSKGHCSRQCHNEVVCRIGTLAVGKSASINITVKPCLSGLITNTALVTANEDDIYPENNQVTDSVNVLSLSDLLQVLFDEINELAASEVISQDNADILLSILHSAKNAINCGDYPSALNCLKCFIEKIHCYIQETILPPETGCSLIKIANTILECLCCPKERGDD